jgi:aromatic-L-amino-acid decarboxylase
MELADSIVVNPHKWLFVPLDFSTLYLRNPELLRDVFALTPEYLRGAAAGSSAPDYMDYGIQLGRRFRALKAWMVFRALGRSGIESRLREHCRLANTLANLVRQEPDFRVATPVNMAIVCIRYEPAGIDTETTNLLNQQIVERVNATGEAYLTYTTLRGKTVIRAGVGNILTTDSHVSGVWDLIRKEARRT